jgi:hypothetical protein
MEQIELLRRMDKTFTPDISVKLRDYTVITSCKANTTKGAAYLLKHNIIGANYDTILSGSGLCMASERITK